MKIKIQYNFTKIILDIGFYQYNENIDKVNILRFFTTKMI